mmetsp:Transcript_117445/g.292808  ORF Transcript_117445/g.292808 Transcript_117445/m.292808 type:complete len:157 (+) Transcript_117445:128-598(+)
MAMVDSNALAAMVYKPPPPLVSLGRSLSSRSVGAGRPWTTPESPMGSNRSRSTSSLGLNLGRGSQLPGPLPALPSGPDLLRTTASDFHSWGGSIGALRDASTRARLGESTVAPLNEDNWSAGWRSTNRWHGRTKAEFRQYTRQVKCNLGGQVAVRS